MSETNDVDLVVILPGTRVKVFDPRLYIDDVKTPASHTFRTATVTRRYGFISEYIEREHGREAAKYPDCCDVIFDHDGRESKGYFTYGIKAI